MTLPLEYLKVGPGLEQRVLASPNRQRQRGGWAGSSQEGVEDLRSETTR
jgi:hypothetical protein